MVRRYQEGSTPSADKVEPLATILGVSVPTVLRALAGELHPDEADVSADTSEAERLGIPRSHVELRDDGPRPDPHRLLVARIYNRFGEFVGFRYAVTDLQRVPYRIVLHADGTEEIMEPETVSPETA